MASFARSLSLIRSAVAAGAAPCAALSIGVRDQAPVQAVFGNAALYPAPVPADFNTRFDMASMTKVLSTTMVTLRLLELGMITLDQMIGDFFPCPGDRAQVTLQQLLTHTGGFVPYLNLPKLVPDPSQALETILNSPPVCSPGTQVHYSCMGFIVLGRILEAVTGQTLDRLADQLVFKPLHMTHTGYCPEGSDFAATEKWEQGWLCGTVHDENARFLGGVSGNAGVFSDLRDMTRFAAMLACGGAVAGFQYLQPETLALAVRCYTESMDQRRGLGFHLASPGSFHGEGASSRCFGHTGFTGTSLIVEPDTGLYAVLLSNRVHPTRENQAFQQVRRDFHTAVLAEFV